MENDLRELEICAQYQEKLGNEITIAQKEIIESMIDPYLELLNEKFESWKLEAALHKACTLLDTTSSEFFLKTYLLEAEIHKMNEPLDKNLNPWIPLIPEEWHKDIKNEIIDSLILCARMLTGRANLEATLIKLGPTLPNLEVQKNVIMELFKIEMKN